MPNEPRKKITLPYLFDKVAKGEPITWLTCYDYPTAYLQDAAGIDMILVGGSLGMTMLGFDSTLPVTRETFVIMPITVRIGSGPRFSDVARPVATCRREPQAAFAEQCRGDLAVKRRPPRRGETTGLSQAAPPPLVQVDERVPRGDELSLVLD